MFQPLVLCIGLRYAYSQKADSFGRFVSWLSMIGIFLGSIGLIVVMSVMNGFEYQMQENILRYLPQVQITTNTNKIPINEPLKMDFPSSNSNITHVTPLINSDVILQSSSSIGISSLMGVNPSLYEPIKEKLFWGDFDELEKGSYHIIIGSRLAQYLNVTVGDKIRLLVPDVSQITPVGKIPSQRLFTIVGIFSVNQDIDQAMVYVNIDDATKLLKYPENIITSWRLFLDNPLDDVNKITNLKLPNELIFKDWRDKRGELFQAIKMEKNIMALLISLIVIVAAFNIITSLSLLVMEKQSEIAILKTQGLSKFKLMSIFIIQGASSGIIGTIVGCLIGVMIASNLNIIMSFLGLTLSGIHLPSMINYHQVFMVFFSLLLLSLISTLYPSYRAANIQPAEALRYE
ncbi:lipoprotein-releasing ABC transporter permease subunit LolC [Orbaceae bacterium ac157xtp]